MVNCVRFLLKLLFLILIIFLLSAFLALAYFGVIPGISDLLGANKPRDLGIKYTEADRTSGRAKSQIVYEALQENTPAAQSIQRFGKREVNAEFSSSEISSLMNNRPWKYWPYANVQVKFNADGSAEISGILLKDKISGYGAAIGAPQEAVDFAQKLLTANPTFYVKGKAAIANNKVSEFEPERFEIGRVPLPVSVFLSYFPKVFSGTEALAASPTDTISQLSQIKNKRELIINYINGRLSQINGFYAKGARFGENKLIFNGTLA